MSQEEKVDFFEALGIEEHVPKEHLQALLKCLSAGFMFGCQISSVCAIGPYPEYLFESILCERMSEYQGVQAPGFTEDGLTMLQINAILSFFSDNQVLFFNLAR